MSKVGGTFETSRYYEEKLGNDKFMQNKTYYYYYQITKFDSLIKNGDYSELNCF